MNLDKNHSHKRCSQCFESKPLDITHFRYKNTEKRWVAKCKVCERKTRNIANKNKRVKYKRKEKLESSINIKVTIGFSTVNLNSISETLGESLKVIKKNGKL